MIPARAEAYASLLETGWLAEAPEFAMEDSELEYAWMAKQMKRRSFKK